MDDLAGMLVFSLVYNAFWGIVLPLVITAIIKYYQARAQPKQGEEELMLDELLPPDVRARTQAIRTIYQIAHDPDLWSGKSTVFLSSSLIRDVVEALNRAE